MTVTKVVERAEGDTRVVEGREEWEVVASMLVGKGLPGMMKE